MTINGCWYNKPVRVLQFNIEDKFGAYVSSISGKELAELAKNLHANVLVVFARDPWGRIYYRGGEVGPEHPKMKNDFLRELITEAKKKGIRVVAMIGHTANKYLYIIHREWVQVNVRGETILLEHVPNTTKNYEPEWPQLCINSPFIEHVKKEIMEVLRLGVDGVFLDSFRYQPDPERACYCKWCREAFRMEYGYDMPTKPSWSDSRWRRLWDWRYKVVARRIKELYELTKKHNEQALFMYNSHPGGWAGRTNRVVEEARDYIDVVYAECSEVDHQPPGFITEMVKLTKAMNSGKPVWASRNYFHLYRTVQATTGVAIRQGLREVIIAGGSPWLLVFPSTYKQSPELLDAAKQVFQEHEVLEEYLEGVEPIRYAGIVVSNKSRDHYGRLRPQKYVDEIRGFYYALTHSHIPVEFISEKDLTLDNMRKYRVLILANTVCMDDHIINNIAEYVEKGGKILATYLTSTRDGEGIPRYEIALGNVLGVELKGILRQPWSYIVLNDQAYSILGGIDNKIILWGDMSYDFTKSRVEKGLGYHTITRTLGEALALGYTGLPSSEWGFEYTLGRSPPTIAGETTLPAIVLNRYGNGESIYFTGKLGTHYWRIGLPVYMNLIVRSILYLGGKPRVRVNAPETVAVEPYIQRERVIVHLLNHTYNQRILATGIGSTKQPLPPYSSNNAVHPPRTIIPVHNIELEIDDLGYGNYRVYSPLRNTKLDYEVTENKVKVKLGVLEEYDVIVIEPRK